MAFKALKKFYIGDKTFEVGDTVPTELVEDRFIRAKKVQEVKEEIKETKEEILTEDSSEVETIVEKPKKGKKKK